METVGRKKGKVGNSQMVSIPPGRIGAVPGFATLSVREGKRSYEFTVEPEVHSTGCIYSPCTELDSKTVKDGRKWMSFADLPISGKTCTVRVHRQRYRCLDCGRTHSDPLPGIDSRRRLSCRLVSFIRKNANRTQIDLAEEVGVSPKTINNVIADFAAEINQQRCSVLPEVLGIDEIYLGPNIHCVLTDVEKGIHFRLLEDNGDKTIKDELSKYPNRDAVRAVAMDMTGRYRAIVEEVFPNATVIVDLFHVFQKADECRESVRIAAAKLSAAPDRAALRSRKGFWDQFNVRGRWDGVQDSLFGPHLPSLGMAHRVYVEFCVILRTSKSAWECAQRYDNWAERIPSEMRRFFRPLVNSVKEYRDEIFAYAELGLTNGFTEGNNGSIRNQFRRAPRSSYQTFSATLAARAERKHQRQVADDSSDEVNGTNITNLDPSLAASIERSKRMAERRKPANSHTPCSNCKEPKCE